MPLAAEIRPIIMQAWSEAARDPEVAAASREVLGEVEERIEGMLPPGTPPEVARLLLATLQGFLVQSLILGDVTQEMVTTAARAAFR